ncbi:pyridoxal phosphate-dependent aminotransferase [Azospirillum soli]|uniref:pyridoxal phosphate-dependent aminotransferase n=1 Tax=Azospirillum soli TaxID=1304799 RepID=UPI001AEB085B|nr:histidinol-phosphate aminotransferase [Azospirillum soli]
MFAKLNTNENPYPPSTAVLEAMRGIDADALRRYPDPTARAFRHAAAAVHKVEPDNIVATNGGDELLRLAITTFAEPSTPIAVAQPSYSLYPVLAGIHGCSTLRIPLDDDWALPDRFLQDLCSSNARLAILVNPHAPSGRLTDVGRLEVIARAFRGVLLVDEAYVDFVDPALCHDSLPLISRNDNVLLLRTLSKGYSLAGLRFAYGIGAASLIAPLLTKTKDSYNTDAIAQRLATAALESRADAATTWALVRGERDRLCAALAERGIPSPPSQGNFLLGHVPSHIDGGAAALHAGLKAQGVLVRHFDEDRLRDALRVTVGRPDQNIHLLNALDSLLPPP